MPPEEARRFLAAQHVAHVATIGADGWPYAIPLVFIYEGGDILYLHTGAHRGHFLANVEAAPRICLEVSERGPLHAGRPYACDSSLVYTSVVAFGGVCQITDPAKKSWFFDRLLAKYGPPAALRDATGCVDRQAKPGTPPLSRPVSSLTVGPSE